MRGSPSSDTDTSPQAIYHAVPDTRLMGKIEVDLPDRLEMQINQLIEEGEYIDSQEAIEDLISVGIKTLRTSGRQEDEDEFEQYGDTVGGDDEYVF